MAGQNPDVQTASYALCLLKQGQWANQLPWISTNRTSGRSIILGLGFAGPRWVLAKPEAEVPEFHKQGYSSSICAQAEGCSKRIMRKFILVPLRTSVADRDLKDREPDSPQLTRDLYGSIGF
ncbi:hypothetical protein UY3_07909 [Chelonia mydas]|uniref:Uncharacterized protein n=1 Tax=Chelonia mydas TaxID=8469 RepID=M7BGY9_CHEMY|nr:hypothetical protein UY3_07909 [Chelonia mydas]